MSRYAYAAQAGGIAIFKSVGSTMQDVAVVAAVLDAAEKKRLGVSVPMYIRVLCTGPRKGDTVGVWLAMSKCV